MEEDYLPRKEHDEFAKRMDAENERLRDEDGRQNKRIDALEKAVMQINELTVSVKEMAMSMKNMLEEQKEQGKRLDSIEGKDGQMWRKVTEYAVMAVLGAVICYILQHIGL